MDRLALKRELKGFMRNEGLTQQELARMMGIQQSVLSEMINGKRKANRLVGFVNERYNVGLEIPDEDRDERDVMPVNDAQEQKPYTENNNGIKFFEREDGQLLMEVPLVPFNVLGSPDDEYGTSLERDRDDYEKELFEVDGVHHGDYISFVVDGDSMDDGTYNGFRRGDIVCVRKLSRDLWLPKLHYSKWPYWVVAFGNCVRLKQIVAQNEETGEITLHSLNPSPEYTDFTLNLDEIHLLYNVVLKKPKQIRYGAF